jgi:hypothetical protein
MTAHEGPFDDSLFTGLKTNMPQPVAVLLEATAVMGKVSDTVPPLLHYCIVVATPCHDIFFSCVARSGAASLLSFGMTRHLLLLCGKVGSGVAFVWNVRT